MFYDSITKKDIYDTYDRMWSSSITKKNYVLITEWSMIQTDRNGMYI